MFNPAKASEKIKNEFINYLTTSYKVFDDDYNTQFKSLLESGITKGPYVDISDVFKTGKTLNQLIADGVVSPKFKDLEKNKPSTYEVEVPLDRPLFKHQETAVGKAADGKNIIVTTGTGSGKTESFLYPVLNKLLTEQENGTLASSGVRAILIYPMNALANDQIKRIRDILMFYPDISFGVFTGDTPRNEKSAINRYRENHANDKYKELQEGLPNERLSREKMYENPPHILITNYVMLEYLLLRPDYSGVFDGSDLKFIVLDESHVYRGATGIEMSMLLRKLRARLGKSGDGVQYILTSATLGSRGKSEGQIANFANQLTDEFFDTSDIVFGERTTPDVSGITPTNIPLSFWTDLANCESQSDFEGVFNKYQLPYDNSLAPEVNTYDLCCSSSLYFKLRKTYTRPVEVNTLATSLLVPIDDVIAFLFVCSKSAKNGFPLLDIHYHFFVRALEGGYVTLTGDKQLFLDRIDHTKDGTKVFEIARCSVCGDIAIIGNIINSTKDNKDYLVMQNSPFEIGSADLTDAQYFHIVRKNNEDNEFVDFGENEEGAGGDDDADDVEKKPKKNAKMKGFWLCPHCGQIVPAEAGGPNCGHGDYIKLIEVKDSDKCLFCSEGHYSGFYVGSDGATSVLGMSLFESLPTKKREISLNGAKKVFDGGKQFLCFSDSRSEAAFFACYEDRIYNSFISRRGLANYVKSIEKDILSNPAGYVTINDLADGLAKLFDKNHTFAESMADDSRSMSTAHVAKNYAWMIVLDQLVGYNRKNYLQAMGYFQFFYRGITYEMINYVQTTYLQGLSKNKIWNFLSVLIMTFARGGAIIHNDLDIDDYFKEYVFKSTVQNCMLEQKTSGTGPHNQSWIPQNVDGKTDQWRRSARQDLVKRVLKCDGKTANDFLSDIWKRYITNPQHKFHAVPVGGNGGYAMPRDAFGVLVKGCKEAHWYRCDSCGKVFNYDIDGDCQVKNCGGHLTEISDPEIFFKDDYYKRAYDTNYLKKLLIKEHTAQLGREKGSEYQEQFSSNKINALSCSTTFEMGVNLGQLETVFLRDMPPSAANYIQRAGRAGRSKEASAYAMTYAKLSSHDFHYYEDPLMMINGVIQPPVLKENNQKIVYRHIFSVVLSYFFKQTENNLFFDPVDGRNTVGSFLKEENGTSGYQRLLKMLEDKPQGLTDILKVSFGNNLETLFGISSYGSGMPDGEGWVDVLIGSSGRLSCAIEMHKQTIQDMQTEITSIYSNALFVEKRTPNNDELNTIQRLERRKGMFNNRSLLDFLVDANVLPKYGFPVDTVELKHSSSGSDLSLSRDMSKAISEYAPGSSVIADGHMYTPRYIEKVVRAGKTGFDDGYYCRCGDSNCFTPNFIYDDLPTIKCVGCGKTLAGVNKEKAIQPSAGMTAEREIKEVPSRKPERLYSSEASYVGTFNDSSKKTYEVNGKAITLISTENDRIMVNTDPKHPFYVCQKCGYSLGRFDVAYKNDGTSFKKDSAETKKLKFGNAHSIMSSHRMKSGKICESTTLEKRLLVHNFNTDIIQILFNDVDFDTENTSLGQISILSVSLVYALLLAISEELEVEQEDISGCLIRNVSDENTNYRIVIYDTVPGGAGHVKRIAGGNGSMLEKIIQRAYDRMDCQCDTSCYKCLRTYQNQRYHAVLSHEMVRTFLSDYLGTIAPLVKKTGPVKTTITFEGDGLPAPNEAMFLNVCSALTTFSVKAVVAQVLLNHKPDFSQINETIKAFGSSAKCFAHWPNEKVLILHKKDSAFYNLVKGKCDWNVFLGDDSFDAAEFLKLFK